MTTSTYQSVYGILTNLAKFGSPDAARLRLMRLLQMSTNPVEILLQSSQVEQFLTIGLNQFGLKLRRLTLLKSIMTKELYREYSTNMFMVVFEDFKILKEILQTSGSSVLQTSGSFVRNGINYTFGANSVEHIFRNYSTGAAQNIPRIFKQYAHNNHLLAQVLRDHGPFVGEVVAGFGITTNINLELVLESISTTTSKITDLTINILQIPNLSITYKGTNISITIPNLKIPVTFDSKVFKDTVAGISGAFDQQFELFFSDRFADIVLPMLNEFKNLNLNQTTKREFLEKYIPLIFRHHIFVPKDFPSSSIDELSNEFTTIILNRLTPELETYMGKTHPDLPMVQNVIEEHVMKFFGDGEFIIKESLMAYQWQIG